MKNPWNIVGWLLVAAITVVLMVGLISCAAVITTVGDAESSPPGRSGVEFYPPK